MNDVDRGTVDFVAEGRDKTSVAELFECRTPGQLAGINPDAEDICGPFMQSTLKAVPLASSKIVLDRFHVIQHTTEAAAVVRRHENWFLSADGSHSMIMAIAFRKERYRNRNHFTDMIHSYCGGLVLRP